MNTNNNAAATIREYMTFNLAFEYEGYTGYEKYAIATDLSEEELRTKYGDEIESLKPFILISWEAGMIMHEHNNNEAKYRMRKLRGIEVYVSEIISDFNCENSPDIEIDTGLDSEKRKILITTALDRLDDKLRSRIINKFFDGLTETQIAIANGCSQQQISKDIKKAVLKLKVILEEMGVNV